LQVIVCLTFSACRRVYRLRLSQSRSGPIPLPSCPLAWARSLLSSPILWGRCCHRFRSRPRRPAVLSGFHNHHHRCRCILFLPWLASALALALLALLSTEADELGEVAPFFVGVSLWLLGAEVVRYGLDGLGEISREVVFHVYVSVRGARCGWGLV
jgi:hypothetical protein